VAEMYIIIICATIPSLRQFYLAVFNLPTSNTNLGIPQSQPTALSPKPLLQPPVHGADDSEEIHEDDAKKELNILSGDRHRWPHPVSESYPRSEVKEGEASFTHRAVT